MVDYGSNEQVSAGPSRVRNFVLGSIMLGGVVGGIGLVAHEALDADKALVPTSFDTAEPSNGLAQAFDVAVECGVITGTAVLAKRGIKHISLSFNEKERAVYDMAHAKNRKRAGIGRTLGAASLIVVGAGAMAGNFIDTAHEVSTSQSNVADYFAEITGGDTAESHSYVISNSPTPELANNGHISITKANGFLAQASSNNITAVPTSWEWHSGHRENEEDKKIQFLAGSLPSYITGLPPASEDCEQISVDAASELGVAPGQSFEMDGLTLKVRDVLQGKSGLNLLPVLFNNEDFSRCLKNNPQEPFSVLLAKGQKQDIERVLEEQGLSSSSLTDRAYVVPVEEFVKNTKETGENSVNPLVLQAMAVAFVLTGAALGNRSGNRLVENRRVNTVMEANGMSKRLISKRYAEMAESEALLSSAVALPVVALVDMYTNSGIPGANLAPTTKTALCVLGFSWGINRLGTAVAMRREAPNIDLSKGHIL